MNKVLKIKEWLERKRKQKELENDSLLPVSLLPVSFRVAAKSLADELDSVVPDELIKRKLHNDALISYFRKEPYNEMDLFPDNLPLALKVPAKSLVNEISDSCISSK